MKTKHIKAYMECAEAFARCSPATRLKVGAVVVKNNRIISCGYNSQPAHISGPCEGEDGKTLPTVRHAEMNALLGLMKSNESSIGAAMVVTHACCKICSVDIVDAGITHVYYKHEYRCDEGLKYLRENGVVVYQLSEEEQ